MSNNIFKPTASIAELLEPFPPNITDGTQDTLDSARACATPTAVL